MMKKTKELLIVSIKIKEYEIKGLCGCMTQDQNIRKFFELYKNHFFIRILFICGFLYIIIKDFEFYEICLGFRIIKKNNSKVDQIKLLNFNYKKVL